MTSESKATESNKPPSKHYPDPCCRYKEIYQAIISSLAKHNQMPSEQDHLMLERIFDVLN